MCVGKDYRTGVKSECLVEACLPSNNECVMHDAKRGGRVSVAMTLVWMCPLKTHENCVFQNKLTMWSVPDSPVRASDERHTSSATRWVWVRD